MSDREYVITIRNETDENESVQTTAPTQQGTGDGESKEEKKEKFKLGKAVALGGMAVSVADRIVSQQHNTITLRTGYEEKQQKAQFAYSIAKKSTLSLGAVGLGLLTGNGVSALFGVALAGANMLVDYAMRQQEINYARQVENNSIFLNQIRMGAGSNREGKTR